MNKISELKPSGIWKYFDEILQIPRPSKKEEKIIKYLIDFARTNKLEYKQDEAGNLTILKPATEGKENAPTVILQSHVDMVCEKNNDTIHNFDTDPIQAYIEDEWVKAKGTTLGADNGIGVAAQLAVLEANDIKHGPIECLFTIDEETGLTGAFNLGKEMITGSIMLNLDSEDDGELFIGCAGGIDTIVNFTLKTTLLEEGFKSFRITVNGLKGGHSGDDIEKGLGNSNKILTRFIWNAQKKYGARLSYFQGGNLRNAIPREAFAVLSIPKENEQSSQKYLEVYLSDLKQEFELTEPNLNILSESVENPERILKKKSQNKLVSSLYSCPNGVINMSQNIPNLVETSTNLASVKFLNEHEVEIILSQRSSTESEKQDIADRVRTNFEIVNAKVSNTDTYPGWKPNTHSKILEITKNSYKKLFKEDPKVRAIHAGLECGLIIEKNPNLDIVSIGPTIRGAHSPDERLHIPAVEKFWLHLVDVLARVE